MFSHVSVGITDFGRAFAFYAPLMERLGLRLRFADDSVPWAGWQPPEGGRPLFLILHPENGRPAAPGNGAMTAFLARDRVSVREAHALALALGGEDAGAPGLRPHYHAHYYGAYLRDPDGNKLCIVCHEPGDA